MATEIEPKWELTGFIGRMSAGRTRPPICECTCVDDPTVRRKMIVKSTANHELSSTSLFCEYVGCRFAVAWGLDAPMSHLVRIDEEAASLFGKQAPIGAGTGVGVEFREGTMLPADPLNVPRDALRSLGDVFAFDLLFQNFDRRVDNPNCASNSNGVFVYDFEQCFSFLLSIFPDPEPWVLSKYTSPASQHVFYRELRRQEAHADFSWLAERIEGFAANKMHAILSNLPGDWKGHADSVGEHARRLADNASKLEMGISEVLA